MVSLSSLDGSKSPLNLFKTAKYKKNFYKEHPTYFRPERYFDILWCPGNG